MSIYTPFTYIIGWSKHKKFYYGAKYARGCQPSDLWTTYFTSSKYVREFREENGDPDIIKIHRTFSDKCSCVSFENEYLTKIDAKNHPLFLNENNSAKDMFRGEISEEEKQRVKETCINKYGVDNPSKFPEFKLKKIETSIRNWGYENPSQVPQIQEKKIETSIRNWGYENPNQSPLISQKKRETCLEKYGYEYALQVPEFVQQRKETCLEKYGYENVSSSDLIKGKKKKTLLENFGVDHPSKIKKICKYCGEYKTIQHENKCKKNPDRKVPNKTGKDNHSTKWYKVVSPKKTEYIIISRTNLIEFAKQKNLKQYSLMGNKIEGWSVTEIKKPKEN